MNTLRLLFQQETESRLLLTISHREEIGQLYPEVLELLVRGTSRQLFPEA